MNHGNERSTAETALLREIVGAAILGNWRAWHNWLTASDGWPDVALLRRGELLLWFIKPDHGRVTASEGYWLESWQRFFQAHELAESCEVRVIRPADRADCLARLEGPR